MQEIRRKNTKDSQDIKEDLQRKEMMKDAAKKKKEKQDDIEAKKRVKARIEEDKAARRQKAEAEKAKRAGQTPPLYPATASGPSASTATSTSKPASSYTETRMRFQTPKGNIMKTFPVTTTLFEVAAALTQEEGLEVQSFVQNFPKKVFDAGYFGDNLKELGLVPSASLVVQ